MPPPEVILDGLTTIANDWRWLAIAWHVFAAALLLQFLAGWRPSVRMVTALLIAPIASVSLVSGFSHMAFNAAAFAALCAALIASVRRFGGEPVKPAGSVRIALSTACLLLGWAYPHFVVAQSWVTYIYAAPVGLVPCPTLLVVIGITLTLPGLGSRFWAIALTAAGLAYGLIGVFRLGVMLDWGLILASATLAVSRSLKHGSEREETLGRAHAW
jgi:hypothetical protein